MNGYERIMKALRLYQPDRVPYDIGGFNREAFRVFQAKTGSNNPHEYFGVEKDTKGVGFKDTKLNLKDRFLKFHHLPENLIYSEGGPKRKDRGTSTFTLN